MRGTPATYCQSLNRPFHILGVDRSLFFLFLGPCVAMNAVLSLTNIILSGILFAFLHTVGVVITRSDNQAVAIFKRHISYRRYYSFNPGIHARIREVQPSVPYYQGKRGLV